MESNKATKIELFSLATPQMRTFHMTWFAFFLCFFAWFGIAPLMAVIRDELGLTKAQIGNTIIASVLITVIARLFIATPDALRRCPRIEYDQRVDGNRSSAAHDQRVQIDAFEGIGASDAEEFEHRRGDVDALDDRGDRTARGQVSRPAHDERHAQYGFVDRPLVKEVLAVVVEFFAVICGENHECVVVEAQLIEFVQ